MTDTTTYARGASAPEDGTRDGAAPGGRPPALSTLRLPQLQALAREMGVSGASGMRKGELLETIRSSRGGGAPAAAGADGGGANGSTLRAAAEPSRAHLAAAVLEAAEAAPASTAPASTAPASTVPAADPQAGQGEVSRSRSSRSRRAGSAQGAPASEPRESPETRPDARGETRGEARSEPRTDLRGESGSAQPSSAAGGPGASQDEIRRVRAELDRALSERGGRSRADRQARSGATGGPSTGGAPAGSSGRSAPDAPDDGQPPRQQGQGQQGQGQQSQGQQGQRGGGDLLDDDDERGGRRGRRGRYRDRERTKRRRDGGPAQAMSGYDEPAEVREGDVLIPVAGILDVLDSYAFVRTSGYLSGPGDVYVSLGQVRKAGLRAGDAVTGAVKQPGESAQTNKKFNALVRLDTVNGASVEDSRRRPEFSKLTPLYPQERLRLETESQIASTRIVDLVAPIGKGQRGLIVSPPKAGKTLMMQAIANAISINNPEVHLMVVLVDERPEEVTDMQRSVKGEVIASTFDRPASDHTAVAELAIERAKRLVELGHDVVVLLDSITRLGRAYNLAAPASGRILSGGVDAAALYPPKRFFGAARNIEHGGSLTILASALVDTGSKMDEVIFEEFKGTGNMELRLDRRLADKRIFPAVDVNPSGTRREEILLGREELAVMWKLRRVLTALDSQQALELLLGKVRETRTNVEFLRQVQQTAPGLPGQQPQATA